MNAAIENDLKERKKQFQSLMAAAPREFIIWAGNWFQTQALAFGLKYDGTMTPVQVNGMANPVPTPTPQAPKVLTKPTNGVVSMVGNATLSGKWVSWNQAPIVKKKASSPVSLHIPKGGKICWNVAGHMQTGKAIGFTKLGVKVIMDSTGKESKVPYYKVTAVKVG